MSLSACSVVELFAPPPENAPPPPFPPGPQEAAPAPPQAVYPPTPEEAHSEIVAWFTKAGYQPYQIDALVQHARAESAFRACAVGPGGYRYLYQWSGSRLDRLHTFARTQGCPQLHAQLAYTDWELRNDPKFTCFWQATNAPGALHALRRGFGAGQC